MVPPVLGNKSQWSAQAALRRNRHYMETLMLGLLLVALFLMLRLLLLPLRLRVLLLLLRLLLFLVALLMFL